MRRSTAFLAALAGMISFPMGGCDGLGSLGHGDRLDPSSLTGAYSWTHQTWDQGVAVGYPAVDLAWTVPRDHHREVFRVYARSGSGGGYTLIATVTSCLESVCRYSDTNIANGWSYDYYIATVDERTDAELGTSAAIRVEVPDRPNQAAPAAPTAISLDGAAYLRWSASGAQRHLLVVQPENESIFLIGETDGTSYYDDRAENGVRYRYHLAAVDAHGHVSSLSTAAEAFPRPDFHADIVYAAGDSLPASGFRFVSSEADDPIVPGNSSTAQWRLDVVNGEFRMIPLGSTAISTYGFTTALTCGPGSDATCVDVRMVPTGASFSGAAVTVQPGFTYLLRVIGSDGRTRYGKLRVQGTSRNSVGHRLMIFDWAYQTRPDERSLNLPPGGGRAQF